MPKTKKIRDMSFEEWFDLKEDWLRGDYELSVHEILSSGEHDDTEFYSFSQYAKNMFKEEKRQRKEAKAINGKAPIQP